MSLGQSVRKLRRLKNLSQSELGKRVGYSLHTISRIERDQWSGSFKVIRDLANFFGVKPEELDESIRGDIPVPVPPPTELSDLHTFNKATIMETLKPLNGNDGVREAVASRLSGLLDNRRFRQGIAPRNHSDMKCRIMEMVMAVQSDELLEEFIRFIEFRLVEEKKSARRLMAKLFSLIHLRN